MEKQPKVLEMLATFVLNDEGYPIAFLWRNTHVIGFEAKEMTLDKYTKLLVSLSANEKPAV